MVPPTTDDTRRHALPELTDEERRIIVCALSKHIIDIGYALLHGDNTAELLIASKLLDRIKGRGAR